MKHCAAFIGNPPLDGTPVEMANAAIAFFEERMPTILFQSLFDHQGNAFPEILACGKEGLPRVKVIAASESDHRNCALAWIRAMTTVERLWVIDLDEFFHEAEFEKLKKVVETSQADAWFVKRFAYWKSLEWRIDPVEPSPACVVVDPKKVPAFVWGRIPYAKKSILVEGVMQHHLTAVRSDEETEVKWKTFHHAKERVPNWYEKVWKAWTPEMENLHPTHPDCWKRAVAVPEGFAPTACASLPYRGIETAPCTSA